MASRHTAVEFLDYVPRITPIKVIAAARCFYQERRMPSRTTD